MQDILKNKTEFFKLASQAWDDHASFAAEPEDWLAMYISYFGELTVHQCILQLQSFLENSDYSKESFEKACDDLKNFFEIDYEKKD